METPIQARRIRFGPYEVDLRSRELRKHGAKVRLQDQPFQVLAMLLEHPGELVTREELRTKLWPRDTFVDFDVGLNTAIKRLRDALNEKVGKPRYIETLPRRGYRFIAAIENLPSDSLQTVPVIRTSPHLIEAGSDHVSPIGRSPKMLWAGALAAAGLVAILLVLKASGLRQSFIRWPEPPRIRSIAVLPLENLTGDSTQEYFADGMTDALITDLAKVQTLRVISRTSAMHFKKTNLPLADIARELNVDGVVEGTVARSGNRVRITAQLIQVANERHLWAESYEGDFQDVLVLQDEVARAIAGQVHARTSPQERRQVAVTRSVNPRAYDAYLKGRFFLNQWSDEGFRKAKKYFQQSIDLDPTYALAHLGLAETYGAITHTGRLPSRDGYAKAESITAKTLEIDDGLAEAHAYMGLIKLLFRCDRSGTARELNRALELNPGDMGTLDYHSYYLMQIGKADEAIAEKKRVLEHDPVSVNTNAGLGLYFLMAGRNDEAIQQLQKTLELDPNYAPTYTRLGWAYANKSQYEQAVLEFKKALAIEKVPGRMGRLGDVYARWGKRQEAQKVIDELKEMSKQRYVSPTLIARIYARLGENSQALEWLGKSRWGEEPTVLDPGFDSLRSDTRFIAMEPRLKPNSSCPLF